MEIDDLVLRARNWVERAGHLADDGNRTSPTTHLREAHDVVCGARELGIALEEIVPDDEERARLQAASRQHQLKLNAGRRQDHDLGTMDGGAQVLRTLVEEDVV